MYRILLVEDDKGIAAAVAAQTAAWDLETCAVQDFRNVLTEFVSFAPHLVLLDISLPFYDGYYWCAEIRKVSKVPIIFISSAGDSMSIVMAMNMGADDFIAKPFDMNVLVAKMQALLRRSYDFAQTLPVLEHRGAVLDTGDGSLRYNGEEISLSKNEYSILLLLMRNRERVVSRELLMETLWKSDEYVDENTLNVNVNRLRRKLEAAGLTDFIKTKVGVGYMVS